MYAYELLPKLKYLTLVGQDDEGNLEFWGTEYAHKRASDFEENLYLYLGIK